MVYVEWHSQGHTPVMGFVWWLLPEVYTCGRPPRIKEITMSSIFSELPVQPYGIMGSALIEYVVRVQLVRQDGVVANLGESVLPVWLLSPSERSRLILLSG